MDWNYLTLKNKERLELEDIGVSGFYAYNLILTSKINFKTFTNDKN
jgi:hypothetical protein